MNCYICGKSWVKFEDRHHGSGLLCGTKNCPINNCAQGILWNIFSNDGKINQYNLMTTDGLFNIMAYSKNARGNKTPLSKVFKFERNYKEMVDVNVFNNVTMDNLEAQIDSVINKIMRLHVFK